ncbi:MAG: carbamoyl phosphate synthase small subunit [Polyangiaceae bacterium UTPRO1]|jgi:carbamoyl-phosphate synthase small subunit|nr:glutamine-hydrolyzing carbamoyl-phosphate synthase small subunit [Myxococcales bacterium]OQY67220.1 MAG: carbamoyl phosphate synthase small subunit [Polyangiaceae bacterium UTPRO1]
MNSSPRGSEGRACRSALLALADGTVFRGRAFGADGEVGGEVVFNTAMTGYQEILTDPSYHEQLVAMTYPEIGNVGVNREDVEARKPFVKGFIVKEYWEPPSNWRAEQSLGDYMREHDIVGIAGIDTRALVRHLRTHGAQEGVISTVDLDSDRLVARAKARPGLLGRDLVREVTCAAAYDWSEPLWQLGGAGPGARRDGPFVVAYDYGIKLNILRSLASVGCRVRVVPASTAAAEVLALEPDGVLLSNGAGDPDAVPYARDAVAALIGKVPIFGICFGHQILALALGGRTYKLKFGHHGANHPVIDTATGKVEITSQNHGFTVAVDSLTDRAAVTHLSLNDHTLEGLAHTKEPVFSVQYHPEASPGPHDSDHLFRRFVELIEQTKKG